MKKSVKGGLLSLCAVLLIGATVAGTLAYLTDRAAVTNTFTVGNVSITMDEAPVDTEGKATAGDRVDGNTYHLIPGKTYDKDPTVHILAGSEDSWLFVQVVNGLAGLEAEGKTIAEQMESKGWIPVDGTNNVYAYQDVVAAGQDIVVFETFTVDPFAEFTAIVEAGDPGATTISLVAYAIQKEGFESYTQAWAGVVAQLEEV